MFQWIKKYILKSSVKHYIQELDNSLKNCTAEQKSLIRIKISEFLLNSQEELEKGQEFFILMFAAINDPFALDYSQNYIVFETLQKLYSECKQEKKEITEGLKKLDIEINLVINEFEMMGNGLLFLLVTVGLKFYPKGYYFARELWKKIEISSAQVEIYIKDKHNFYKKIIHGKEFDNYPYTEVLELCEYKPICMKYDLHDSFKKYMKNLIYIINYSEKIFGLSRADAIKMINKDFNSNIEENTHNFTFPITGNNLMINLMSLEKKEIDGISINGGEDADGVTFIGNDRPEGGSYWWTANLSDLIIPTSIAKQLYTIFWKLPGWEPLEFGKSKYIKKKKDLDSN